VKFYSNVFKSSVFTGNGIFPLRVFDVQVKSQAPKHDRWYLYTDQSNSVKTHRDYVSWTK